MEKIHNTSYYYNTGHHIEKKKLEKFGKKKTIISEEVDSFEEIFHSANINVEVEKIKIQEEKLENILKQIGNQGKKLKKTRLLTDLDLYKKLVKKYLSIVLTLAEKTEKKILWNKFKK